MTLAHDEAGAGPAVLLLHSTAADRRMWDPQVPALAAAGYRAVRCDLRGYGESPVPAGRWDDAGDVAALLDALDTGPVAVVAASGGGRVALEFAARWPGRVTALVLLCTAVAGHEPSPALRAFGEREDALLAAGDVAGATELNVRTWLGPRADPAAAERLRVMQRHAFDVQLAAPEDAGPLPRPYELSAVTAPALLVSGGHDLVDFRGIAADLAARLPGARHVELDWAGHLPSMEDPGEVNRLLAGFLATVVPGSGGPG